MQPDVTRTEGRHLATIRATLVAAGIDGADSLELADADPVVRLLALSVAQAGCVDPLPVELVEVLDRFDDLAAFVHTREEQELT